MKKSIKLILAVVILALLIVALKFIPASSQNTQAEASPDASALPEDTLPVITLTTDKLSSVTFNIGEKTLSFLPPASKDGHWAIKDLADFRANNDAIDYRLEQAITLKATRKIDGSDLSEFGLDKPTKMVTYELKDGTTQKLLIGNAALDNASSYAMVEGDEKNIYLLSNTVANCITTDLSIFCDTALSDFNANSFLIKDMAFSGTDISPVAFNFSANQNGVVACYEFTMDDYKDMEVSAGAMENIKAAFPDFSKIDTVVAADVADLSEYGLDKPAFHMVINYSVNKDAESLKDTDQSTDPSQIEKLDLTFGKELEDGKTAFLIGDDTHNVYAMDASFISTIKPLLTPFTLCSKYLDIPSIDKVKTIDVDFAQSNSSYHINVDNSKKTYDCNGTKVEDAAFKELYRSVIGIVADKLLETPGTDTKPLVTIKYTYNDGSTSEVNYTASPIDQYYQATLHDKMIVGCSKKQFTELQTALDKAMSATASPAATTAAK